MTLRSFTLHDQIERNALLHGGCTAFVADGQALTHAQYAARVASQIGRASCRERV